MYEEQVMTYLKATLSTLAALFLAVLTPMFWTVFRGMSQEKATGLDVVAGGLLESILSPWFWILVVVFSAIFYITGRCDSKVLRILFFWIPTITTSVLGFGLWTLMCALFVWSRRH
jgi:type IV secretory pathway VirB3-like protein